MQLSPEAVTCEARKKRLIQWREVASQARACLGLELCKLCPLHGCLGILRTSFSLGEAEADWPD
jgi:hypothetical protein